MSTILMDRPDQTLGLVRFRLRPEKWLRSSMTIPRTPPPLGQVFLGWATIQNHGLHYKSFAKTCHEHHVYVVMHVI